MSSSQPNDHSTSMPSADVSQPPSDESPVAARPPTLSFARDHMHMDMGIDMNLTPLSSRQLQLSGDGVLRFDDGFPTQNIPLPSPIPPRDGGPLNFRPTTEVYSRRFRRPAHKYEHIALDDDTAYDERLHCLNGLVPLDDVFRWLNGVTVFISIIGFIFSCVLLNRPLNMAVGIASLRHFLLSCSFALPLLNAFVALTLLASSGFALVIVFVQKSPTHTGFGAQLMRTHSLDVIYHSLVFLSSCFAAFNIVFTAVVAALLMRPAFVVNTDTFVNLMHSQPYYFCTAQRALRCSVAPCDAAVQNVSRFSNCPGVFCVEFCRVGINVPFNASSVHPICRPCKRGGARLRNYYQQCRALELDISAMNSSANSTDYAVGSECYDRTSSHLYRSAVYSLLIATAYFMCIVAINSLACYKMCFI